MAKRARTPPYTLEDFEQRRVPKILKTTLRRLYVRDSSR
jgi:hypothetical protein